MTVWLLTSESQAQAMEIQAGAKKPLPTGRQAFRLPVMVRVMMPVSSKGKGYVK